MWMKNEVGRSDEANIVARSLIWDKKYVVYFVFAIHRKNAVQPLTHCQDFCRLQGTVSIQNSGPEEPLGVFQPWCVLQLCHRTIEDFGADRTVETVLWGFVVQHYLEHVLLPKQCAVSTLDQRKNRAQVRRSES